MTPLQLELTRLLWKKTLSFGCEVLINQSFFYMTGCEVSDVEEKWDFQVMILYSNIDHISDEWESSRIEYFYNQEETRKRRVSMTNHWNSRLIKEIIGHKPELTDFHRFLNNSEEVFDWTHDKISCHITVWREDNFIDFSYDSSKDLLEQEEDTMKKMISLVKSNQQS